MHAADSGLEHADAPDWNLLRLAQVVDAPRRGVAADAAELDVDDPAGAQLDGRAGVLVGVDAFIEANRSIEFALQFCVAVEVVPAERLRDNHQVIGLEALQ